MRARSRFREPGRRASRTYRHLAGLGAIVGASAAVAACGNLLTGPGALSLEGGRSAEGTFKSGSLQPAGDFSSQPRIPGPPVEYGGISFQAFVLPVDTALDAGPMGLSVQVRARNESSEALTLPVGGCTVWPEFYDAPDPTSEPEWVPEGQCAQGPYEVVLEPGQEEIFHFLAYDVMLADGLEDGRYHVFARFNHADRTLRLDAGTADVRLRLPNMVYQVRVEEHGGRGLAAEVQVENRNAGVVQLEFGACAAGIELYENPELTGSPIALRHGRICPSYLAGRRLAPGEVLEVPEFQFSVSRSDIRHVPRGVYQLAVTLELNARTYRFPMGTVRLGG